MVKDILPSLDVEVDPHSPQLLAIEMSLLHLDQILLGRDHNAFLCLLPRPVAQSFHIGLRVRVMVRVRAERTDIGAKTGQGVAETSPDCRCRKRRQRGALSIVPAIPLSRRC